MMMHSGQRMRKQLKRLQSSRRAHVRIRILQFEHDVDAFADNFRDDLQ
jgi:hypothetical protein